MESLEAGIRSMMERLREEGEKAAVVQSAVKAQIIPKTKSLSGLRTEMFLKYYGLQDLAREVSS